MKNELVWNPKLGENFTGKFEVASSRKEGFGEFKFPNGDFYKGKFEGNKWSGLQGLCIFSDGTAYLGEWKYDFFNGVGQYLTKEGHVIEGNFSGSDDSPYKMKTDTDLKILYENGELYEGKGRNGKRDGKGRFIYLDGSVYEGHWEKDKRHGTGQISYADGSYVKGLFLWDKLEDC